MRCDMLRSAALAAAYEAGRVLAGYFGRAGMLPKKGEIDLVTEADIASEKTVMGIIEKAFPTHAILSEEIGELRGSNSLASDLWIIDPLDGTTNYAHGLPVFAVSIAFVSEGETRLGVVHNPLSRELFMAERGQGATLNGRSIGVSGTACLLDSLVVTGFPYNLRAMMDALMLRFSKCLSACQGVRRLGSAALDLCYVACGRFDAFWEQNLAPWDTAAGALIVEEAGGRVTDFLHNPFSPHDKEILASNGSIHEQLAQVLQLEDRA